ncbi:hypothetical protein BDK51DRAFT_32115, partial [Blyttiomyces helicus]
MPIGMRGPTAKRAGGTENTLTCLICAETWTRHCPRYAAVRAVAFSLDLVIPSAILCVSLAALQLAHPELPIPAVPWVLILGSLVEVAFLARWWLERRRLQKQSAPKMLSEAQRAQFIEYVIKTVSPKRFKTFLTSWFLWKDSERQLTPDEYGEVRRGNLRDWLAWSIAGKQSWHHLLATPDCGPLASEINAHIAKMESRMNVSLPEGTSKRIHTLKLNYNPVEAFAKPMCFYLLSIAVGVLGNFLLRFFCGLHYVPADMELPGERGATREVGYFVRIPDAGRGKAGGKNRRRRSPTGQEAVPLVFIHGIGGGPFCYIKLFWNIIGRQQNRPIFMLDLRHVTIKLHAHVPSQAQLIQEVDEMLRRYGYRSACFVGHSLGTYYATWFINHTKLVASSVLIDPVCFK